MATRATRGERRRMFSKRELGRRSGAFIETVLRLAGEGKDPALIARAVRCSEELVEAVLRTHPPEKEKPRGRSADGPTV